jgi:putative glutamine amidotransferase
MSAKPIILIPSATHRELGSRLYSNSTYICAIESAGGLPVLTGRPTHDRDLDQLIAIADGLLLLGGSDVDPKYYNTLHCPHIADPDSMRDELELALLARAEKKRIPILGICRGMQLMNVWQGGTLYRDICDEFADSLHHDNHHIKERNFLAHEVAITPSSLLASLAESEKGVGTLLVNSLHHQGLKTLGRNLLQAATAPDGLVEAIELADYPFGVGVQWHPEELTDAMSVKLFHTFVGHARANVA